MNINTDNPTMVGYAYVPIQMVEMNYVYSPEKGFEKGTLFPCLDKPLGVYGKETIEREVKR